MIRMSDRWVSLICLITLTTAFMLATMPLVKSAPTVSLYGYTDKLQYMPSETGTVYFWIYNWGPEDIILNNITIYYPWYSPIWGGNRTIANIDLILSEGEYYNNTDSFAIFDDSRATGGYIEFLIVYTYGASVYQRMDMIPLFIVVSEFTPMIILPLFMIATLLATGLFRRKHALNGF